MGRRTDEQIKSDEEQIKRVDEQIKSDEEKTYQYISGLAKSRRRVSQANFNYYNIRLTNQKLLNLILAVCEHKKLHLPSFIEELLVTAMRSRDKTWRQYFESDNMQVELQDSQVMTFRRLECGSDYNAPQLQRMNAGKD
jgi:hypothetical protein